MPREPEQALAGDPLFEARFGQVWRLSAGFGIGHAPVPPLLAKTTQLPQGKWDAESLPDVR